MLLYVGLGACGVPVFAGHSGGMHILIGPTAGYLASYPIAGFVLGRFAEAGWDRNVGRLAIAMATATVIVLGCGWAWLATQIGPAEAFAKGVLPFVLIEVLKGLAATGLLPGLWKLIPVPRRNL
jgi:biotin transport system substrate-specific component